ncbi:hypothetical protein HYX13_03950 [Candidatus Woesearchaeota archaeon]|nr:hypothetical protein [Candidatus Woesearchaeota archaeon]
MISWHGILFASLEKFWENLRVFSYRSRTVLEVFFIFLYAFEQILLLLFTFTITSPQELNLIISLFALLVLTTFSLHKLVMESRIKTLEKEVATLQQNKTILETSASQTIKKTNLLLETLQTEILNSKDTFQNKKR